MSEAGKRLVESARQALDFVEGKANREEYCVHIPDEIDVRKIRESLQMEQAEFARNFGFDLDVLREWEEGRSMPKGAVRNYLIVIQKEPEMVRHALFVPPEAS